MKYITKYIMSLLLTLMCVSCQDDMFSDFENTVVSQPGQYNLSLEMLFTPQQEVELNSRSAGDRISDISNLHIALFDEKGEYVDHWYFSEDKANWNKVSTSQTISGTDPDSICKVTTTISIPYNGSEMYLLAVANMGNVIEQYGYRTLEEFRAIKFDWDPKWGPNSNRQMSGYFTVTKEAFPKGTEALEQEGIPPLTLNSSVTTLHAWLRRAASKVTVDFDASGLRENIWIFIKDVRIRDIPASCTAFNKNIASEDNPILNKVEDGESIDYTAGTTDWRSWPSLSKTRSDLSKDFPDAHGTTAPSLFFYENMQGKGKDKAQIVEGDNGATPSYPDGSDPNNAWYKDAKPYGTYVEVNGYYYSTADNNVNSGPITYRFMLGKDTYTDYNVERNHHYKLTLVFNGNANDADWHIDYKYAEDRYVPETYYISYLYGQRMHLPITIGNLEEIMPSLGNDGYVKVEARIIESHWFPDEPAQMGDETNEKVTTTKDYFDPGKVIKEHRGPWTGFLSLQSTEYSRMNKNNFVGRGQSGNPDYLKKYWEGDKNTGNTVEQGNRKFILPYETKTHIGQEEGDIYQVTTDPSKQNMVFYMPLYTRALFMVKEWSYSGNNPFEEFTRSSKVEITINVYDKNGNPLRKETKDVVNIIQVPRIFNPKGVYRKNGNDKPFEVTLMQAVPGSNGTQYQSFLSKGPWSAQIESASEGSKISINGQKAVFGSTDSPINFTIKFNSNASDKTNQYAIILVRYHNFTCNHRILVRQGYEPDFVSKNVTTTKWHCFNLRTGKEEATSPIETGSFFKYGNLEVAIAEDNFVPGMFNVTPTGTLKYFDPNGKKKSAKWSAIYPSSFSGTGYFNTTNGKITLKNGKKARIAFGKDFEQLRDQTDTEYGYGICYADEATSTANVGVAGGSYYYNDSNTYHYGTLGCFVYSKDNSHNLFLPAGRTGYGAMQKDGAIRYAIRAGVYPLAPQAPLLWRIYKNYGVNYWLGDRVATIDPWNANNKGNATAWDINISSFDFNTFMTNGAEASGTANATRALPIRLVED